MADIPQSIRFTTGDKLEYAHFHSKQTERITTNQDLNAAELLVGIDNAAEEISEAQIEAGYIVADAIYEGTTINVRSRKRETDRIVKSLEDLKATFDWNLSEMIWILEQQREYLKGILEVLKKPRLTQANELRESALR
jgi:hypothetical protein